MSSTFEPSSCELSRMRTRARLSSHVSKFTCLAYTVTHEHPLHVAVLLCTVLYREQQDGVCISSPGCLEARVNAMVRQPVLHTFQYSLYCRIQMFTFCLCFLCIFLQKVLQTYHSTVLYSQLCLLNTKANFVGLTNKLDLGMCSQNRTRPCAGDLLHLGFIFSTYMSAFLV